MSSIAPSHGRSLSTWKFLTGELRPKGRLLTPFNIITGAIILTAAVLLTIRFAQGLGAVSNVNQDFPWGVWKGFNVVSGVALAGGAYVLTFMVYILGLEKYKPIVRVTVLNGFLAYVFYAGALVLDLGRPWKIMNPIIGNSFGFTSVLFLVAWHFLLYMTAELIEFSPAIAEWLGKERARKILKGMAVGAVVMGISLSTLHQSGLGALFLMAKPKIHPLWYSEFIPLLFFISSIFAGLAMVIFEGSISHHVFRDRVGDQLRRSHDLILVGLARICGVVMFVYLFLHSLNFMHGQLWHELHGFYGALYLTEIVGLVALPMILFLRGAACRDTTTVRVASVLCLLGVILNRLNISVICYKWYETKHYVPSWMELVIMVAVVCAEIWVFRWVVRRLPVLAPASEDSPTLANARSN
jgi:Ni/Fe-hydrogenase subunit HybB-like protein